MFQNRSMEPMSEADLSRAVLEELLQLSSGGSDGDLRCMVRGKITWWWVRAACDFPIWGTIFLY